MDTRPRCQALRKDGTPCRAAALPGETLCWVHSPTTAEARREACQAGGRTRLHRRATLTGEAPAVQLHKLADVLGLVSETVSEARRGNLDCKVANVCLYRCSIAHRVIADDVERRVEQLEEAVRQLQAAAATRNGHASARPVGTTD
jgi:hypothetical protein